MNNFWTWIDIRSVLLENVLGIAGIVLFVLLLHLFFFRIERDLLKRVSKGLILVLAGLVLFMQGVNVGLVPAGEALSSHLGAHESLKWALVPLAFILGLVITWAEPSVKILCSQVDQTTSGHIRSRLLQTVISFGVALFAALGVTQIIAGFPLQFILVPGYILVLGMMLLCNRLFVGIAFDSCTVSTGPMVITFVMALAMGLSGVLEGRDPLMDGFGLVAVIALAPIVSVLAVGVLFSQTSKTRS